MLSQWREIARSFSGREAKYGTVAIVSSVVVLAILIAVNYLGVRHNKRWDLTAAKQFTLSEQTRKILDGLQKPVAIKVFAQPDDFQRFRDRLEEYQYASKQVTVEYIDAVKQPSRANQYQVQQLGTVVFDYDGRTERVTSDGEQELTNGLIKVVQGKQLKVYFVQGHGEKSTEGADRDSYGTIAQVAGVRELHRREPGAGPAEGRARRRLGAGRRRTEDRLLRPGSRHAQALPGEGRQALSADRSAGQGRRRRADLAHGTAEGLGDRGRQQRGGRRQRHGPAARHRARSPGRREVPAASDHRSLQPADRLSTGQVGCAGDPAAPAGSSRRRWSRPAPTAGPRPTSRPSTRRSRCGASSTRETRPGPISLAAAVSSPATDVPAPAAGAKPEDTNKPETRIVVFGDSDFASNAWLGIQGNRDLFMNIGELARAAGEPDLDPAARSRGPPDHADGRPAGVRSSGRRCSSFPG